MVIARLYEGEIDSTPPSLKRLLYEVYRLMAINIFYLNLNYYVICRKFLVVIKMVKIKNYL